MPVTPAGSSSCGPRIAVEPVEVWSEHARATTLAALRHFGLLFARIAGTLFVKDCFHDDLRILVERKQHRA